MFPIQVSKFAVSHLAFFSTLLAASHLSAASPPPAQTQPPPKNLVEAEASLPSLSEPSLDVGALIDKAGGFELRLWSSVSAGAAPGVLLGVGGMPQLGLSARVLWGFVEPEILLGYGAYAGYGHTKMRLSAGSKFILNLDLARPFLWLGYSHIHETLFTDIANDPIGTTLTTADAVGHRSGVEVGIGLLLPFEVPLFGARVKMELYTRATAMYLPQLDKVFGMTAEKSPVPHDGYLLIETGFGFPVLG